MAARHRRVVWTDGARRRFGPVKTKIVRIGSSYWIRIPKPLIEQAGLGDEVELRVVDSGIFIERTSRPRAGWSEAASLLHVRGEDGLLDEPTTTEFDETEWTWE